VRSVGSLVVPKDPPSSQEFNVTTVARGKYIIFDFRQAFNPMNQQPQLPVIPGDQPPPQGSCLGVRRIEFSGTL
jgi:hypothetical protein